MGARQFCTCGILALNLTSLACIDMASEQLENERSNMNHIVDMINIEMFTIDDYSISHDDRTWILIWIMYHLDNLRDVDLSGCSLVI